MACRRDQRAVWGASAAPSHAMMELFSVWLFFFLPPFRFNLGAPGFWECSSVFPRIVAQMGLWCSRVPQLQAWMASVYRDSSFKHY
jgi:hypothetical protein